MKIVPENQANSNSSSFNNQPAPAQPIGYGEYQHPPIQPISFPHAGYTQMPQANTMPFQQPPVQNPQEDNRYATAMMPKREAAVKILWWASQKKQFIMISGAAVFVTLCATVLFGLGGSIVAVAYLAYATWEYTNNEKEIASHRQRFRL